MIGIIGAMKPEIDGIKAIIEDRKVRNISGIEFVSGKVGKCSVVAAQSGIGKVFASICTQTMILEYSPQAIINVGVGGSLCDSLNIGDIAVAEAVVQHDMDTTQLGDPIGLLSGINIVEIPCGKKLSEKIAKSAESIGLKTKKGLIASGDQFVGSVGQKNKIKENFDAIACDMEGGGIGHTCYVNDVDYCVIRAVSDNANGEAAQDYPEFMRTSAENSVKVIKKFLAECE